ncbi:MAG: PilN domain-containing protein [Lysobacterales bacterium]|jgi:general secretion pathway protein L
MATNQALQKLEEVRARLRSGPVGKFFEWWIEELRQAMPAKWQQKLIYAARRVTIELAAERFRLGVDEDRGLSVLEEFPLSQDPGLQRQQIDDLLAQNDLLEAPQFMLLDGDSVLQKEVRLPLAAEANLAQVLTFEMDRQTPFRASSVYFDWQILDRDSASGQLQLMLYVTPRSAVDGKAETLAARGFSLAGVDISVNNRTLGLNLLPAERRTRQANPRLRFNLALGAACAVLLALVMVQSLYLREHQVSALQEAIEQVQGEAREVMRTKQQIQDASEAAGFLARRRAESPLAIALLADVTRTLPDDTYLERLVIGQSNVQMQGKSQNAQQLIERVNQSPLLDDASFRGSTRLDARTGLEVFEVNAQVAGNPVDGKGGG